MSRPPSATPCHDERHRFATSRRPIAIDSNPVERATRPVALPRENRLFAGSDAGGGCAAAIYSLTGTAKLNSLDPEACLRHVIGRIADHPVNHVDELPTWNIDTIRDTGLRSRILGRVRGPVLDEIREKRAFRVA